MKKLFLILLSFFALASYGQQETEKLKITENVSSLTAPNVNVQETDGVVNYRPLSGLPISNPVRDSLSKKLNLPTGFLQGLQLSINADPTKYNIASGYYVVTDFTNLANPVVKIINYPGATGLTPLYLASANSTYIALDKNMTVVSSASPFTDSDRRTLAIIGNVVHSNHTTIDVTNEIKAPIVAIGNQLHDFMKVIGFLNEEGNVYSPNGANMQINKSVGKIWGMGINSANYLNPHVLSIAAQTGLTFAYRMRTGIQYANTTSIDPNNYDNAGVLTAIPVGNRWTIQRINLFQSGLSRVQYGQTVYTSFNDAVTALPTQPFVTEQNIADNAVFRCYLIVKQGETNLTTAVAGGTAQFVPVDKFGNIIGNGSVALTFSNIVAALGYTPENVTNKQNSLAIDGTGQKYPTIDAVNAAFPVNYSKIVYVNATNPNSATIFDLNNPPTVNDNLLKSDVANLYIGTDASGWVYNSTSLTYVTKTVTSATSNFYLAGTTTDAGSTKTAPIQRTGSISIGGNSSQIGVKIEAFSTQKTAAINAFTNFTPDAGVTMPQGIAMGSNDIEGVVNTGYALMGYNVNSSSSLGVMSQVAQNSDVGNIPLTLIQSNRLGNSGVTSALVVNRPILGISNFNQRLITVLPSGNTGFGKDTPSEKIDVLGAVKISGTSSGGMLKFEHPTAISTNVTGQLTGGTTGENVGGVMSFVRGTATGRGSIVFDTRGSGYNANALVIREDGSISNAALAGTGTRQVVASSTGILSAGSAQPLKYVALLNQTGTSAPTATVLENNLGGTVVWTRSLLGNYVGTLSGAFTTNKTVILHGNGTTNTIVSSIVSSVNAVGIVTSTAGSGADGLLSNTTLEIRVYP